MKKIVNLALSMLMAVSLCCTVNADGEDNVEQVDTNGIIDVIQENVSEDISIERDDDSETETVLEEDKVDIIDIQEDTSEENKENENEETVSIEENNEQIETNPQEDNEDEVQEEVKDEDIVATLLDDDNTSENLKAVNEEETNQVEEEVADVKYVAEVNGEKVETLANAVAKIETSGTIKLIDNVDLSETGLTIPSGKEVTLDLAGKTIKGSNATNKTIQIYGKLVLADSSDINKNGDGSGKIYTETKYNNDKANGYCLIQVMNGGTFVMDSGFIDAASFTSNNDNDGQFAVGMSDVTGTADTNVIINGGHIKAGWYAVAGNGNAVNSNNNITVNGGLIESVADYAIYHPQKGTTTINGGTVYGAAGGIHMNRGNLVIKGGTITSKGIGSTGEWGDGTGGDGNAAVNAQAEYGDVTVTISGGKFTAEGNAAIIETGNKYAKNISITGGVFSSDVSKYLVDTENYRCVDSGSIYVVQKIIAATVGDTTYPTLQKAFNEAKNSSIIKLASDITGIKTAEVPEGKTLTLDLNGHTISTGLNGTYKGYDKHYYAINNYGTLTIKDSVGTGKISSRGLDNYGTMTIESGTFEIADSKNGGANVYNEPDCSLTINGGTFIVPNGEDDLNKTGDGAQNIFNDYGNILITGGTFESTSTAIYSIFSYGDLEITPAEGKNVVVHGTKGALGIDGGTTVINGGDFSGDNFYAMMVSSNYGEATVTVNAGSFNGKDTSILMGSDKAEKVYAELTINEGTFNKKFTVQEKCVGTPITIKGGLFVSNEMEYLAQGYNIAKINDTYYKVTKNGESMPVETTIPAVEEGSVETIKTSAKIVDNEKQEVEITNKTKIVLEASNETLTEEETKKVESVENKIVKDSEKEELKTIPLDITLKAITGEKTSVITDLGQTEDGEDVEITVTLYLDEATAETLKDKDIKIIRIHDDNTDVLDAELNGNVLTFKTGKFSTYVIAYTETIKVEPEPSVEPSESPEPSETPDSEVKPSEETKKDDTKKEETFTKTEATKSYDPKDKNHDGVVTCDEEMGSANWIWSESKKKCVYKVMNSSTK